MTAHLRLKGYEVNRKRVQRLMVGISAIFPGPNTSQRNHQHKIYPYLLKDLDIIHSNQVWATDITFIRLCGGFAYLVAVMIGSVVLCCPGGFLIAWRGLSV